MNRKPDPRNKDKVIADSGWGVKPDDQPANAGEARAGSARVWDYDPAAPDPIRDILRAQRRSFNTANKVIVRSTGVTIVDINGDRFDVRGLTYGDPNLIEMLKAIGAAFNPQALQGLTPETGGEREYALSKAWAWGAERTG